MNKKDMLETIITKIDDPEEPLFLLRGRDPLASIAVLRWVYEAKEVKVNPAKIRQAEDVILDMLAYPNKKLPD